MGPSGYELFLILTFWAHPTAKPGRRVEGLSPAQVNGDAFSVLCRTIHFK